MDTLVLWNVQKIVGRELQISKYTVAPGMYLMKDLGANEMQCSFIEDALCKRFKILFPRGYFMDDRSIEKVVTKVEELQRVFLLKAHEYPHIEYYKILEEARSGASGNRKPQGVFTVNGSIQNIRHQAFSMVESENCD